MVSESSYYQITRLPVSGFVEITHEEGSLTAALTLAWAKGLASAGQAWHADKPFQNDPVDWRRLATGEGAMSKPGNFQPAFAQQIQHLLHAAKLMPDGSQGLLIFGNRQTRQVFESMPQSLHRVLIKDAIWGQATVHRDDNILIASTMGHRDRLFLCLNDRGVITVLASRNGDGSRLVNQNPYQTHAILLDARIEESIDTDLAFQEFQKDSPDLADLELEKYFWHEISPKLDNPFARRDVESIHPTEKDILFERGDLALARGVFERILSLAIASKNESASTSAMLGFITATPIAEARMSQSGLKRSAKLRALSERAIKALNPRAGRAVPVADGDEPGGNRLRDLNWKGVEVMIEAEPLIAESAHYHFESENRLVEMMADLGVPTEETKALISSLGHD